MKLERIWQEYERALKKFLAAKIANPADVEDVMQEVLIKTYSNLHDLKQHASVKAWLFQIANRTIIDFYRKNSRLSQTTHDKLWYEDGTDEVRAAMINCIHPFLTELPEADAKLLTVVDIEGRAQKDYANDVGISYSTLKSRVQKSRQLLKERFEQCCDYKRDRAGNVYEYIDKWPATRNQR